MFGGNGGTPMYVTMADSAPKYADKGSWETFVPGRWATEEYEQPSEVKSYYDFAADGTFHCLHMVYKIGGKWTAAADSISLTYETLNGKPLQEEMERIKRGAESGRQTAIANDLFADWVVNAMTKRIQLSLSEDTKELQWGPPSSAQATSQLGSMDINSMMSNMSPNLKRLEEKK